MNENLNDTFVQNNIIELKKNGIKIITSWNIFECMW